MWEEDFKDIGFGNRNSAWIEQEEMVAWNIREATWTPQRVHETEQDTWGALEIEEEEEDLALSRQSLRQAEWFYLLLDAGVHPSDVPLTAKVSDNGMINSVLTGREELLGLDQEMREVYIGWIQDWARGSDVTVHSDPDLLYFLKEEVGELFILGDLDDRVGEESGVPDYSDGFHPRDTKEFHRLRREHMRRDGEHGRWIKSTEEIYHAAIKVATGETKPHWYRGDDEVVASLETIRGVRSHMGEMAAIDFANELYGPNGEQPLPDVINTYGDLYSSLYEIAAGDDVSNFNLGPEMSRFAPLLAQVKRLRGTIGEEMASYELDKLNIPGDPERAVIELGRYLCGDKCDHRGHEMVTRELPAGVNGSHLNESNNGPTRTQVDRPWISPDYDPVFPT